ncbi:MAG: amidase [Rhodospirillales bacterium]
MILYKAEDLGAFVTPFGAMAEQSSGSAPRDGPLAGLTFALKDLYDVAGIVTGCGSPRWAQTHGPAAENAPVLDRLLAAGAVLMGKTHTDELAYSLLGMNPHYGTPLNPRAPDRIPGGSSNGSASAVAAGIVDFAIGSDTGGSVRLPASFCGIFGMRPSYGRVSLEGVMALAPSFDTAGWFARDAALLQRIARVLLPSWDDETDDMPSRVLLAEDAFERMNAAPRETLWPHAEQAARVLGEPEAIRLSENGLEEWMDVFRVIQAREAWNRHGDWIREEGGNVDKGVYERFLMGSRITDDAFENAREKREEITARMNKALDDKTILIVPTTPDIAPLKTSSPSFFAAFRNQALSILCIAGLARLPQITLPITVHGGAPLGLSVIGPRDGDAFLLRIASRLAGALGIEAQ